MKAFLNLKVWLFAVLLSNLKEKFVDGSVNLLKIVSESDLFMFMRLFVRRKSFVREVRQVHVKKGKRKYTLLFVTTNDGTTRFNLGRHFDLTKGYLNGKPVQDYFRSPYNKRYIKEYVPSAMVAA